MAKRPPPQNSKAARDAHRLSKARQGAYKGRKVSARSAMGRERDLASRDSTPVWLTVVLDAFARQRATNDPIDRILSQLGKRHRLGTKERKLAGDAAFSFVRNRKSIEKAIDDGIQAVGGVVPASRDRDLAGLLLALAHAGHDRPFAPALPVSLEQTVAHAFADRTAVRPTLPKWVDKRLRTLCTDNADYDAFMDALFSRAPFCVAFDQRHVDEGGLQKAFDDLGKASAPSALVPHVLRLEERLPLTKLADGLRPHVWPMDDGSRLVAASLGNVDGQDVLDLCGGGGGKSKVLALHGADLVCADRDARRLANAKKRLPKGTPCVQLDGTNPPFASGAFDAVLVDAPCSGTGTLRRTPDLLERLDEKKVKAYAKLQRDLLAAAADLVKPGGRLIYATCSLLPDENTAVTADAPPSLRPLPLKQAWAHLPGSADRDALVDDDQHQVTLLPHTAKSDGFFIAAFTKV